MAFKRSSFVSAGVVRNCARFLAVSAISAGLIVILPAHLAKDARPARFDRLAPIAPLPPVDTAVAEALRNILGYKLERFIAGGPDRAGVITLYRLRGFAPLWIENGTANARADSARAYLGTVDSEGLDPGDYPATDIVAGGNAAKLAEAELKFTDTIIKYARDAQNGRIAFSRVSADVDYPHKIAKAGDVLGKVAEMADVAQALASFNPPQQGYKALRAKLAALRGRKLNDQSDQAVPSEGTVIAKTAGSVGSATRPSSALDQAEILVANMERWRWMPRDLGSDYVMVNIANYKLTLMHDGSPYLRTNVVVGAPDLPTPLISAPMKSITVNPRWNIPTSMVEDEYLPALKRDPGLAARMGLKIETSAGGNVRIYQLPGDFNVLGRIRFNFPNKFLVYQHDTDDKQLFGREVRDSSHGCMRVQDPFTYAAALLSLVSPRDGYTEQRLRGMIGDNEVEIALAVPIPVHLTYQTAFVDDYGDLIFRQDIYGLDTRLIAALRRRQATSQMAGQSQ
jgi:murein L,D-transpeptidase YcbB/YkuD